MRIKAFITHKIKENFADCQDRFAVNQDTKSIAVSDGMGSTWQQKIWAQLLVEKFSENTDWHPNLESIKPLCTLWRQKVEAFIQDLKDTNAPENMIYRNERNLAERRSAGATFVGIRFDGNNWNGSVLGDSCLIEWDGSRATFYTSQDIDAFDSYPDYFDSDVMKEGKGSPKDINGTLSADKCILLVSDPFSDFLLEANKQGTIGEYFRNILALSSHQDFETLVNDWRNEGMHNDDATMVIVENDGTDYFTLEVVDDIEDLKRQESIEEEDSHKVTVDTADTQIEEEKVSSSKDDESNSNNDNPQFDIDKIIPILIQLINKLLPP